MCYESDDPNNERFEEGGFGRCEKKKADDNSLRGKLEGSEWFLGGGWLEPGISRLLAVGVDIGVCMYVLDRVAVTWQRIPEETQMDWPLRRPPNLDILVYNTGTRVTAWFNIDDCDDVCFA